MQQMKRMTNKIEPLATLSSCGKEGGKAELICRGDQQFCRNPEMNK